MTARGQPPGQTLGQQFIAAMDSVMLPLFREAVAPVYRYAHDHDHARLLGTATLVAIAGRHFLVTAAHAVQDMFANGVQQDDLYVPNLSDGAFVPVVGRFNGDRTDAHDFAFIELDSAAVERLRSRRFLTLADIDLSTGLLPNGWYYIHGYPYENATRGGSRDQFRAKPYTFGTALYRGETDSLRTFSPEEHVLLEVKSENVVDGVGNDGVIPSSFQGISGSPIWRAFTYGDDSARWTPAKARVVAVETCVTKSRGAFLVRGTRWFVVLPLLRHAYPDLAPAIALHDPPTVRATVRWEDGSQ